MPIDAPAGPDQLRSRIADVLPVRDLSVARVVAGVAIALIGLAVWFFMDSGEGTAPETTLPRATTAAPQAPGTGATGAAVDEEWVVQVAGAVVGPGVIRLSDGARVGDAIDRAGGATPEADLDRINLAAKVVDGQRIYVVRRGESPPAAVTGANGGVDESETGPVDLNSANEAALDELPGVGPATAKAIIDYRSRSGPFRSVDDLGKVKGIGPAKLEQIKPLVRV